MNPDHMQKPVSEHRYWGLKPSPKTISQVFASCHRKTVRFFCVAAQQLFQTPGFRRRIPTSGTKRLTISLTWRLVTRRREISLKTLRRGKKAAQTKGSQDTTQGNQPETLRRGKRTALLREHPSMLRRYTVGHGCAAGSGCAEVTDVLISADRHWVLQVSHESSSGGLPRPSVVHRG